MILQVAWAPGKGFKDFPLLKDYWDMDEGVSFIPWNQMPSDLNALAEGAVLDEESLPEHIQREWSIHNLWPQVTFHISQRVSELKIQTL